MYGMVNNALRGLVLDRYGAEAWGRVHEQVGAPAMFEPMKPYGDDVTYGLVQGVVTEFGVEVDRLLFDLGTYWIQHIAMVHYADLMAATGSSFRAFVSNLDHMHARIRVSFPSYQPPSFRVLSRPDGRLQVDYYSERPGLLPFVEGLFDALAVHFQTPIAIEAIPDASHGMPCKRMMITVAADPA